MCKISKLPLLALLFLLVFSGCEEDLSWPVNQEAPEEEIAIALPEQVDNQAANLINGGLVVEEDGWLYYSNFKDGGKIYRVHADGGEHVKVNDDYSIKMTISDGWIYYLGSEERSNSYGVSRRDQGGRIYKIRTDGSERTLLLDDYSWELLLADGWIYHTRSNYGIYRFRVNGTGHQALSREPASFFNIRDGWLYYCNGYRDHEGTVGAIHRISIDGGESSRIGDQVSATLNVVGEWIYYDSRRPDWNISKIHIDGSEQAVIVDSQALGLNIAGDWIYYLYSEDVGYGGLIYRIRTDGTELAKLSSDRSSNLIVIGDWIYYTIAERDEENRIIREDIYRMRTDGSERALFEMAEPEEGEAVEEIYYVSVDEGNHLFIRASAGIAGKEPGDILKRLPRGSVLNIIDRHHSSIIEDNYTWWEVLDPQSGLSGWAAAEYLRRELPGSIHGSEEVYDVAGSGEEERGNTPGNLINSGIAAGQEDWIYYTVMLFDEERQMSSGGETYKVRHDGSGLVMVNDSYSPYLNVVGNWIYYTRYFDLNTTNKVPADGGDSLLISREYAAGLNVVDGWIYYLNYWDDNRIYRDNNRIFKMLTDGSERTRLNDTHSSYLNVVGGWIYYSNQDDAHNIYKMRTDGSGKTRLNHDYSDFINVIGDWIYYRNGSDGFAIYKMRTDGSERTRISDDVPGALNVTGGWIYYSNLGDNYAVYKMRPDGSLRTQVNNENSSKLNVVGDWMFYESLGYYMIRTDGSGRQKIN